MPLKRKNASPSRLDAAQWRAILAHKPLYFEVTSDSMRPTFRPGDKALIRPLEKGEPRPGQTLAFFRGELITHRYLGKGVCRGDNALGEDLPVERDDMVGIATEISRDGKIIPLKEREPAVVKFLRALTPLRRIYLRVRAAIFSHGR